MVNYSRTALMSAIAIAVSACGGGGGSSGGDGSIKMSGVVGSGYTVPAQTTAASLITDFLFGKQSHAISGSSVDKVVAIPYTPGAMIGGPTAKGSIEVDIDPTDQSFELPLSDVYDWVLLLVNSAATNPEEKVVAYVTMSAGAVENLLAMPLTEATDDVNLGTVNQNPQNPEEVESSRNTDSLATSFSLTSEQLLLMAKTDDAYKNFVNLYINYDKSTDSYYAPTIRFNWESNMPMSSTIGASVQPDMAFNGNAYKNYFLYMSFDNTKNTPSLADLCAGTSTLVLEPPADVTTSLSAYTYGPTGADGLVIPDWTASSADLCVNGERVDFGNEVITSYPPGESFTGDIPSGWWKLRNRTATDTVGSVVGEFDLGVLMPRDAGGNVTVPVPVPRLTTAADGTITRIDVDWYVYDKASSSYQQVTDLSILDKTIYNNFFSIYSIALDGGPNDGAYMTDNRAFTTIDATTLFNNQWVVPDATPPAGASNIYEFVLSYNMAGNQYSFAWMQ